MNTFRNLLSNSTAARWLLLGLAITIVVVAATQLSRLESDQAATGQAAQHTLADGVPADQGDSLDHTALPSGAGDGTVVARVSYAHEPTGTVASRLVAATAAPVGLLPEMAFESDLKPTLTSTIAPESTSEPQPDLAGEQADEQASGESSEMPAQPPPAAPVVAQRSSSSGPVRLRIPRIGVDAHVESVGMTPDRVMESPRGWQNVAWFNLGVKPGKYGNAVMAGHVDDTSAQPAVFWRLSELVPGDQVSVAMADGSELVYEVTRLQAYQTGGMPMREVFGMALARNLNLTTCHGGWDTSIGTYDERLVAFTTLVAIR